MDGSITRLFRCTQAKLYELYSYKYKYSYKYSYKLYSYKLYS